MFSTMLSNHLRWADVFQTQASPVGGKSGRIGLTVFLRLGLVDNDELLPKVRQYEPLRLRTDREESRS